MIRIMITFRVKYAVVNLLKGVYKCVMGAYLGNNSDGHRHSKAISQTQIKKFLNKKKNKSKNTGIVNAK